MDKKPESAKEEIDKPDTTTKESKTDENSPPATSNKSSSSQVIVPKSQMELIDKALKCMNILMDIASQSTRNIIIDQVR